MDTFVSIVYTAKLFQFACKSDYSVGMHIVQN